MSTIYYVSNTFCEGERPDFTDALRRSMPVNQGQARCHSISYKTIVTGVLNALRYFQYYRKWPYDFNSTAGQSLSFIAGMVYSVCCMRLPGDLPALYNICRQTGTSNYIDRFNQLLVDSAITDTQASFPGISRAFGALKDFINSQNQNNIIDYNCIATSAHNLVVELNSCRANLRVGSAAWNSSIQDSFDMTSPDSGTTPYTVILQEDDSVRISNLLVGSAAWNSSIQDSFDMTSPDSGTTPYTVILQEDDSVRISNLLHLTLGRHTEVPQTQNALTFLSAQTFNGQAIKYSSDNRTVEFLSSGEIIECEMSFYYYNYFAGNVQTIPFV